MLRIYVRTTMKILIAIDLQKEFRDRTDAYERCLAYIKENHRQYDEVIATYFRQNPIVTNNFSEHLDWNECRDTNRSSVEIAEITPRNIICKPTYGIAELLEHRRFPSNAEIHIIGCDLDACIYAACFNLWDAGYSRFKVLTDYCYICGGDEDYRQTAISLLRRNFGDCIV